MKWQLQEAKQRISQVVRQAIDERPQNITRHDEVVAVVLSAEDYSRLRSDNPMFKEYLISGAFFDDLEIDRKEDYPREIEYHQSS